MTFLIYFLHFNQTFKNKFRFAICYNLIITLKICSKEKLNHKSKSIFHRDSFWNLNFSSEKKTFNFQKFVLSIQNFFLLVLLLLIGLKYIFYTIFYDYINIPTTYLYNLNQCAIKFHWLWMWRFILSVLVNNAWCF